MNRETAELIVKGYAVLCWLGAALLFFAGLGITFWSSFMSNMIVDETLRWLSSGLGTAFGLILVVLGVLHTYIGVALWRRRPWSRIAALVLSVPHLFNFPLGTLFSAFIIWFFGFSPEGRSVFGAPAQRPGTVAARRPAKKKK